MSEFKVGDKVRVIRSPDEAIADMWIRFDSESGVRIGDVGVISSTDEICACVDFDGQENFYMNCEQLELVTEPFRFKVGDRVVHKRCGAGKVRRVDTMETTLPYFVDFDDGLLQWVAANKHTPENTTKTTETPKAGATASPERQSIVALIEHGQPKPSHRPYVHATTDAATKEAERLAGKHPGHKFGVYQLVTARIGTVSVAEA